VRSRVTILMSVVALLAVACGSQVDRSVFEQGAGTAKASQDQASSTRTGAQAVAGPGDSSTADAAGAGAAQVAGGATATTVAGAAAAGGGAARKANYASDVGVTASSIKLGNITTIGGPMPGQFEPFLLGVRTWVNEVNEKGGINGRKVQLSPCDDGLDAERNRACARDLVENQKVFALVGTNTPAMPSARYINDKKVPAVGVAPIGNYVAQLPYWFSAEGMRQCPRDGNDSASGCSLTDIKQSNSAYRYFRDQLGVKKAAVFWHNVDISKQAGQAFVNILRQTGIDVVYTAETQVAEPDYTGHVLQMRDRGVEGIWDSMEVNNNIRLMQAMDRQGFLPKAKVTTAAAYSQEIGKQVTGPSRNILFALSPYRSYTATGNPAISHFEQLFNRYFKGQSKHIWNVEGYAGGQLFGDAAAALGADLTRDGLVRWLDALKDYDAHGLGPTFDYRYQGQAVFDAPKPPKASPYCWSISQWKGDDFAPTPGPDFKCDGDWVNPKG
jgi:branched-chain amino acid transport system substrate-binding protein